MNNFKKILALVLALVMCVAMFAACGDKADKNPDDTDGESKNDTPLVVGYSPFNSKFSPFFAETAYDQDVSSMTQLGLLTSDRTGAIIMNGIKGETVPYDGKDYTYYGPADLVITPNDDGTVYYDFTLRDDIKFSDGEKLTVDDVIFSMYVLCDPTYDGSATLFAQPILGLDAYRAGMTTLSKYLAALGEDNTDFTYVTEEQQAAFWKAVNEGGAAFAQGIVDYCVENGYNEEGDVAGAAANWGFAGLPADATAKDLFIAIGNNYDWVFSAMEKEVGNSEALSTLIDADVYNNYPITGVKTGESASKIEGIQKTGENSFRVVLTEVSATAIYQFSFAIAPMHYYGNASLYDYDNDSFGFVKGDLSTVRAKTTQPMGAGVYKFNKFENGVVYFEASENYYLGNAKTKYVQFLETKTDDDKLNGVLTGTIDITDPTYSTDTVKAIQDANGGETSGSKIHVSTVDNLGYGYMGMSANRVNVAGNPASEASKNLRKAIATVVAAYRDLSVDSYYGERASVINYPISNTSWAAPQATDDGYAVAFSKDVNGNEIYTSDMDAEAKYAAAINASLGYFEAAGYTVTDGKLTAAPEGAKLAYEAWIPADGTGDHPSFMMLTQAHDALATIGFDLIVKDLANSSDLWSSLEAEGVDMWCAAWGATVDPDMYQIYFSGDDTQPAGGSNYMYDINDAELNTLILDARKSLDQAYRKTMYKACLDIIVDWAVEVPVYQRQNAIIFSAERVNLDTVTPDITTFYTWLQEIKDIEMK